ncbi:MAG: hypothetical protein A4E67_01016 [Syntrophaceae bacterium PtaB.Bin038]|nr:MAG: hypothetical protein A4E67_01016 [Syntrophaceae bacterium PtaB.Bin038]
MRGCAVPRCRKCGEQYDEDEGARSPVETLGEIFLESAGEEPDNLCPGCREEIGVLGLLAFGE